MSGRMSPILRSLFQRPHQRVETEYSISIDCPVRGLDLNPTLLEATAGNGPDSYLFDFKLSFAGFANTVLYFLPLLFVQWYDNGMGCHNDVAF